MPLLLGAIADDYTGAADLASMLSSRGVRTALFLSVEAALDDVDLPHQAAVIALKTRSIAPADARAQSLEALEALRRLGCRQIYFKYCSTFDSSAAGNIGPVAEALMEAMDVRFTVAVPALPVNGRTQYLGHLFVGDRPLSESHMRHHPIHPMTDSNLVRHLQAQSSVRVGLLPYSVVQEGAAAIRREAERLEREGTAIALVDVLADEHLFKIAEAVVDLPLITGGSGLGMALPSVWELKGVLEPFVPEPGSYGGGGVLVLSGSCSEATLDQIAEVESACGPGIRLNVLGLLENVSAEIERLHSEAVRQVEERGWALVYSSAAPEQRTETTGGALERGFSAGAVGETIEAAHGELARRAVAERIVDHVVVAGGETSGAVVKALNLEALEIADVLDPGVPVMRPLGGGDLTLTLKSGNFGSPDFFSKTLRRLGVPI